MTSVIAGRAKELVVALTRSSDSIENTALKRMVDPKHVAAAVSFSAPKLETASLERRSKSVRLCALSDVR
jgi:hypothetical protein